jgi:hypothetical protein
MRECCWSKQTAQNSIWIGLFPCQCLSLDGSNECIWLHCPQRLWSMCSGICFASQLGRGVVHQLGRSFDLLQQIRQEAQSCRSLVIRLIVTLVAYATKLTVGADWKVTVSNRLGWAVEALASPCLNELHISMATLVMNI